MLKELLENKNKDEIIKEEKNLIEEEDFSLENLSKDELINIIEELTYKRMLNTGNVEGISMDEKSFEKGVVEGSFYAGIFQALVSSGMEMEEAYNITLNISTSKGNLETAKANYINAESQNI